MSGNPLAAAEPWDLVADGYAAEALAIMEPFSARALELAGLSADSHIVDVAAGPGTLSLLAAPQSARVTAIDFAGHMLEVLNRTAAAAGHTNIETHVGDGQALPFPDGEFDAGFSMFGLMFFPDRTKGFAELLRVLRPGGVAVVSAWAPVVESPLMRMMFGAMAAADPAIEEPQPNYLSLENPEVFATEMRTAGFAGVTIQRHTNEVAWDSGEQMWDQMARSSAPLTVLRRSLDERTWSERATIMRDYLTTNYSPRTPLATTAFLGIGHKPA
ncbi:class I SAM-dependent methyltransferase [Nocardia sp. NPDC127579]|uniref:class I SAM-dependent methyltransferase n=1 Tax=Nocardia sp. NPDC127579 TaxID=3345402 RepID=UPI003627D5DC